MNEMEIYDYLALDILGEKPLYEKAAPFLDIMGKVSLLPVFCF